MYVVALQQTAIFSRARDPNDNYATLLEAQALAAFM